MYCPKCGTQNPDNAQSCGTCGAVLTPSSTAAQPIIPTISGMAIAALILGLLSFILGILTGIPAIILGIIALVKIEKSGGRITGKGFAIAGIVVPVFSFALMIAILLPALSRVRQTAFRMVCGTNLSGIGKAMMLYANDYDDEFPRAGGRKTIWSNKIADWQAPNRYEAFQIKPDKSGGEATITSSLYLLVKYSEVTPRSFICKSDTGVTEFSLPNEARRYSELFDFWDFGPNPREHCSYSYHMPYGIYALTTSSNPGMAVAADRNPWIAGPATEAKDFARFNPDGDRQAVQAGNSPSHQNGCQNVLFLDTHVELTKSSDCGIDDDNIYTSWDGQDIRRANPPVPYSSQPQDRADSLLVNDGP